MKSKKILVIVGLLALSLLVVGCTPKAATPPPPPRRRDGRCDRSARDGSSRDRSARHRSARNRSPCDGSPRDVRASARGNRSRYPASPELTLEELTAFNGKNGARAYVAVDGVLYDVTDSPPGRTATTTALRLAGPDRRPSRP